MFKWVPADTLHEFLALPVFPHCSTAELDGLGKHDCNYAANKTRPGNMRVMGSVSLCRDKTAIHPESMGHAA